uniref:Spore coat protein U domain-containing protein n=1 Tax=uncultured Thiotrichaceae bacterium TaxID=298394 RepID=A0A6S6SM57_9GAMM|nr:MAG: Unknown protein [uncultured Thiotrichaceae bacterium]
MKKIITAMTLTAATLGLNTAVMAESPIADEPIKHQIIEQAIVLKVEKMPTVALRGSLFEQPIMPTAESLESGEPTALGEMDIISSAGTCAVSITTANNFALTDWSTEMTLSGYTLNYQDVAGTNTLSFGSNSQGAMPIECASQVSGMMSLMPQRYNSEAPAGVYSDIVTVLVEVAG